MTDLELLKSGEMNQPISTIAKNKMIAEMIGGKYLRDERLSFEPKGRWHIKQFPDIKQDYELRFHSYRDMQFEALDYLYKTKHVNWLMTNDSCSFFIPEDRRFSEMTTFKKETLLLSMFEMLFYLSENLTADVYIFDSDELKESFETWVDEKSPITVAFKKGAESFLNYLLKVTYDKNIGVAKSLKLK